SPASSPNILPFENDKVADNEENNDDEMDNDIYEVEQVASPSESSSSVHRLDYTYPFQPPSDTFIRSTLEKLKIPFIRKALHFWAEVLFTEIPKRSSPESTFAITSWNDSFFKCLSCFFTGKENHYFYIKAQIQAYICNNFRTFESDDGIDFSKLDVTGQKFKQFYQCNKLTTTHYEFICAWLQCRIGVYTTNGILERYGNWSDNSEEYIPILLMQNYTGLYKPVLTLL
uniref:Uncharacterized protein n=1 Tax=Panagrolaimus sp. ES5 TaxID=591445 RepID=A0AC34G735_9BILA